jgi:hypothetical protein
MGNVPAPSGGLGSGSNYFIYSDCNPLTNLQIVLDVQTDIIANIGFGLQLNCYSKKNNNISWQQYFFSLQTANGGPADPAPGALFTYVNNWNDAVSQVLVYLSPELVAISDSKIAAKSKLTITLGQDSATDDINSVTFVYTDASGTSHPAPPAPLTLPGSGNPQAYVAPIVGFQVNLVGPINAKQAYFWSGAGTITYSASQNLTASSTFPSCDGAIFAGTGESANTTYGELPTGAYASLTQTFGTVMPPAYAPGGHIAVSQQFNDNVTNVYTIDRAGQFVVFFVAASGHWKATTGFGPTGLARQGAGLAASEHFGIANQTDVFLIDQNGQLEYFWINGSTGAVNGPQIIQQQPPNSAAPSGGSLAASQQFGATNQTDVFLIDNNGQLVVFYVQGTGHWQGPQAIGATGFAPNGSAVAASQQFGAANQTDVFLIGNNGQLVVFYVQGTGKWQGPHTIGATDFAPAGGALAASRQFSLDRTDVFLVDNSGQLVVFYVDGTGDWQGPQTISAVNFAPPGCPVAACQHAGTTNQTDVFVVDNGGQLWFFWVIGGGAWNGPQKIGPAGFASQGAFLAASNQFGVAGQTDLFVVNQTGTNAPGWPVVCWVGDGGSWNGPKALVTEV